MSDQPTVFSASEEVDERQLELAREEGEANRRALEYMIDEVAQTGRTSEVGDYVVGVAIEEAEGLYALRDEGELEWTEPDEANCHLEVAVADAADWRFVPELSISATFESPDGEETGPVDVPFVWHPGLYHYGTNVPLPGDGTYSIRVRIEPPTFHRHDRENGRRFGDEVEVTFEDVHIETGQS